MAEVIKKAILRIEDLPEINSKTGQYYLRYRIVSEDKSRISHWSPIQKVEPNFDFVTSGELIVEKISGHVQIIWNPVNIELDGITQRRAKEYDIWLRWHRSGAGDWLYNERIESTSVIIIPPDTYTIDGVVQGSAPNRLDVEIYLKGSPISRGDGVPFEEGTPFLKVYRKLNTTV
jgi:hypothetical protein